MRNHLAIAHGITFLKLKLKTFETSELALKRIAQKYSYKSFIFWLYRFFKFLVEKALFYVTTCNLVYRNDFTWYSGRKMVLIKNRQSNKKCSRKVVGSRHLPTTKTEDWELEHFERDNLSVAVKLCMEMRFITKSWKSLELWRSHTALFFFDQLFNALLTFVTLISYFSKTVSYSNDTMVQLFNKTFSNAIFLSVKYKLNPIEQFQLPWRHSGIFSYQTWKFLKKYAWKPATYNFKDSQVKVVHEKGFLIAVYRHVKSSCSSEIWEPL